MSQQGQTSMHPCAVCGESNPDRFRVWFDAYLKLYKCRSCGFVAQYPGPGQATIVQDYSDRYDLDFVSKGKKFKYPEREKVLQNIVDRIHALKPQGKLLDIGCGDGQFIHLASKYFECAGVEGSRILAEYAGKITGAPVACGMFDGSLYPEASFDVISMIQVLEHIPNPAEVLKHVRNTLAPGGLLVVEVPSINAPHFLAYRATRIKAFVKPPTGVIHSHCNYFSPGVLVRLIEGCGFTTVSCITGRWQYKYHGFLRLIGKAFDPFMNITRVGGILYIGEAT